MAALTCGITSRKRLTRFICSWEFVVCRMLLVLPRSIARRNALFCNQKSWILCSVSEVQISAATQDYTLWRFAVFSAWQIPRLSEGSLFVRDWLNDCQELRLFSSELLDYLGLIIWKLCRHKRSCQNVTVSPLGCMD